MKTLLLIFSFIFINNFFSQDTCKFDRKGMEIQIGIGLLYGGLGVLGGYQFILKEKMRISPIVGYGFSIGGPPDQKDTIHSEGTWLNSAIGFNFEYGQKHRLFFGPQMITANYVSAAMPNSKRLFFGSSIIVGYKGIACFGLMWQIYLGVAHMQSPLMDGKGNAYFAPHIGIGFGYKF